MPKILIVEDDPKLADYFCKILIQRNYKVVICHNSEEFFARYESFSPSVILLDIKLKDSPLNGLEIYQELVYGKKLSAKVIVVSGEASRSQVARAMKLGAYSFIEKKSGFNKEKFLNDINQALNLKLQEDKVKLLNREKENLRLELMHNATLIGESSSMMRVKELISKFSRKNIDILIEGETGTGKDVVAKQLFLQSDRIGKPYIVVNSGGIPESLIDSELFGHKKGSFTGAYKDKQGYFEQADKGVLFLDEISNLNLNVQAKILRTIEKKEIRKIGGISKNIDVRLIFASNKILLDLVEEKKFRDDLYYRLGNNIITLPPLRDRGDDVMLLLHHFCQEYSQKHDCRSAAIDDPILKKEMKSYSWPGNVRELKKFVEYVFVMHDKVDASIIVQELRNKKEGKTTYSNFLRNLIAGKRYSEALQKFEKYYLEYYLKKRDHNVSDVADEIGLDRTTLYRKLKKFEI